MTDIFISYSSEDRSRVEPIVDALKANGWSVWWDRELKPGPSYDREIEKAIDGCHCVVVVWSSRSVDSEWVRVEAGEGMSRGILVPVCIEQVPPPLAYRNRQTADLSGQGSSNVEHEYRQFMAAVADTLDKPFTDARAPSALRTSALLRWSKAGVAAVIVLAAAYGLWLATVQSGPEPALVEQLSTPSRPTESREALDHFQQGIMLMRKRGEGDQFSLALAEFDQALVLEPKFAKAQAGRCRVFIRRYRRNLKRSDFEQAEQACFRALTHQRPGESGWEVRGALGDLYREAGEYDKSLDELQTANRLHPNSSEVQQQIGLTYAELGQMDIAERHLMQAIALEPNNWTAQVALGNFRYDTGDYEGAISIFERVLSFASDHPGALIGLGSAMYMLQRFDEATVAWDKAARLVDDAERGSLAILQSNLGLSLYYKGEFAQAVQKQRQAAELAPDDHRIWGRLAESYRHAQMSAAADEAYREAIRLAESSLQRNSKNWETLGLLGLYHGFLGNAEAARHYVEQMFGINGIDNTAYYFDALVYWSLHETQQCFKAIEVAIEKGFSRELIRRDPDLRALRATDRSRYDALLNVDNGTDRRTLTN